MADVRIYLVPHPPIIVEPIGRGYLKEVEKTRLAMRQVAQSIVSFTPLSIIISTPHNKWFTDKVGILTQPKLEGSFSDFGFPSLRYSFENDQRLTQALLKDERTRDFLVEIDSGFLDHGALVFLDFLTKENGRFKLVILTASYGQTQTFFSFGLALKQFLEDLEGNYVYVASGDLSHCTRLTPGRDFHEEGPRFDSIVVDAVNSSKAEYLLGMSESFINKAQQCGLYSFLIAFGLASGDKAKGKVFSYEDPFGVGYLVGSLGGNDASD